MYPMRFRPLSLALVTSLMALTLADHGPLGPGRRSLDCSSESLSPRDVARQRGIEVEAVTELLEHGFSLAMQCSMPARDLEAIVERAEMPRPDSPAEYGKWRVLSLQDENGNIAADGLLQGKAQLDAMKAAVANDASPTAGIARGSWSSVGPGNIGGRIRSIIVHPTSPSIMWLGSVSGGIWKTTDGGTTWAVLDDFMANLSVTSMVMNPADTNMLFAATGEPYSGDALRGAGIFKTTDGGATWTQLASTSTSPSSGLSASDFWYTTRITMSANAATLLASTTSGLFRSTDKGVTFTRATSGGLGIFDSLTDVDFHPSNSNLAIASGFSGKALYSSDGGATWASATGLPASGRVEVAYAPSNGGIVYASVETSGGGTLYKSVNGGQTYTAVTSAFLPTSGKPLGSQGWYDNIIWVSPVDSNFVLWGGIDLWRSTDGGANFTQISDWAAWSPTGATSAHADQHMIVAHPSFDGSSNKTVFFGNDGGIYKAIDITTIPACTPFTNTCKTGWTELNNTLAITQFYGGAGHPGTGKITGGTQDNGTLLYDPARTTPTESWTWPYGGDGGFSAYDPTDVNYFYGEYVYATIHRNTSGGASTSNSIYNGLTDATAGSAEFIAAFRLDPNNANRMLVAAKRLWRTNNVKATGLLTWEYIKDVVGANEFITAIGVAPGNSDIVYTGYGNGKLYKTTMGTSAAATVLTNWTTIDNNGTSNPLPNRRLTRITIDASNNNIVYVTFGGFSGDNVYKSTNGGSTWTDITGSGATGLPDVPVRSLVINPNNSNWIYVGTEVGVFASEDGGSTWALPHDAPSNVSVDELFFLNTQLVAVTHGRGMFMSASIGQPTISSIANQSTQIDVPVTANFTLTDTDTALASLTVSGSSSNTTLLPNANITFGGSGGSRTVTLTPASGAAGSATVTLTVSDGTSTASTSFTFSVNARPTISAIANQNSLVSQVVTLNVTVADAETAAGSLTLSGTSSNTTLLPNSAIAFSGSGGSRVITLTPASGATGTSTVTIAVSDGAASGSTTFTLSVTAAPTISSIANQTTTANGAVTVNFTLTDQDTSLTSLTVSGSSSNTAVLANNAITFGGSGGSRTATLSPVANAFGTTTVTISVSDGLNSASSTFTLTVTAPPTIATIANQTTALSSSLTVNATISDADTSASSLTLTAASSNTTVLPNSGIALGGSTGTRTVTMTPAAVGSSTVTLTVNDGTATATTSFTLTVTAGPGNLVAVVKGNLVSFQWAAATIAGLSGYQLEAGATAGTTQQVVPVGNVTTFSTSAPSGVYFVRVRALVGGAASLASNEISVAIGSAAAPGAPSNLLSLVNGSTIHLAWENEEVGGTRSSTLLEAFTPAGAFITSLPLDPSLTSFSVAAPANTYSLRLKAIGPSLQSAASNSVLVTVPGSCAAPATPRGFTATSAGGIATMTWALGAVGTPAPSTFVLEAGRTSGATNVGSVTLPTTSFSVPIPPGTYFLRVRAVNACGQASANTADVTLVVP